MCIFCSLLKQMNFTNVYYSNFIIISTNYNLYFIRIVIKILSIQ